MLKSIPTRLRVVGCCQNGENRLCVAGVRQFFNMPEIPRNSEVYEQGNKGVNSLSWSGVKYSQMQLILAKRYFMP